jgi:hypothetical protein
MGRVLMAKSPLPLMLSIVLLVTLILILVNRLQSEDGSQAQPLPQELADLPVSVIAPEQAPAPQGLRREGYSLEEKPFVRGGYSFDERTKDFRLVCARPCPVQETVLEQEFAAISYALSTMRGVTQADVHPDLLPFEVHASADSLCKEGPWFLAYMDTNFTDASGYRRGLLCFFFDKKEYNRDRFPYSTSVHEVTHMFAYGRIVRHPVLWEGMSEMMESFFLRGNVRDSFCWEGNDWFGELIDNPHDPHGTGRQLFFTLCKDYGFDYDDLPALFARLDHEASVEEFVAIVSDIAGKDTSRAFKEAGVI